MPLTPSLTKARVASLLAVLALGAGGGLVAGCGGDNQNASDDTVPTAVTTSDDGGAVTTPGSTDAATTATEPTTYRTADAIENLHAAGLIHRVGNFVFATRAAHACRALPG